MSNITHIIEFTPSGRGKARCDPNPDFPEGVHLDVTEGARIFCDVTLPYPAPECGYFVVRCSMCNYSVAITAAGRVDDPRTIKLPCKFKRHRQNKLK